MNQGMLIAAIVVLGFFLFRAERTLRRLKREGIAHGDRTSTAQVTQSDAPPVPHQVQHPCPEFAKSTPSDAELGLFSGRELLFENAMKATRDGLWDWDRRTDQLHFNSRFLDMLGYPPDAFPQEQDTWRKLLHPDEREEVLARQQKVLDSPDFGDEFEHIFRLRSADGSYRWFMGRILNVRRDSDGRAIRIVGANVDITDLKELREKATTGPYVQDVLTAISDGAWEWSISEAAQKESTLNDADCFFTMLGRSDDGLMTCFQTWRDRIHPEDRDLAVNVQLRIMMTPDNGDGAECTYRYMIEDGSYRWMLGRTTVSQRDEKGRALRVVGVHTDITELKAIRSELELRSERLNYAFAAARDGLWDLDLTTNEVYYSPRYLTMLGYMPDKVQNTQDFWENAVHPDDREQVISYQSKYVDSPESGDSLEQTYRFRGADGSYRWILARALVVSRDPSGRGLRLVGLHTDVTEMRRTQESLRILLQHDTLTGLHSRSSFESKLASLQSGVCDPVSLMVCDIDGLKLVNDYLGHAEGDRLLVTAATILGSVVRKGDIVARIGGDEMVILMPACPESGAMRVLEDLETALALYNDDVSKLPVYISSGLATFNMSLSSPEQIFREADSVMRHNKNAARSQRRQHIKTWIEHRLGRSLDCSIDDRTC